MPSLFPTFIRDSSCRNSSMRVFRGTRRWNCENMWKMSNSVSVIPLPCFIFISHERNIASFLALAWMIYLFIHLFDWCYTPYQEYFTPAMVASITVKGNQDHLQVAATSSRMVHVEVKALYIWCRALDIFTLYNIFFTV